MTVRVEPMELPPSAHPARWLLLPLVGWAVVAAASRILRQRARRPSLPRMSDEWLAEHEAEAGRTSPY